jgi:tRNA G18 (ribose-2'-O)-methylase SpoU
VEVEPLGVGPWDGPWPDDPRLDPELLREGDARNVEDRYRYWTVEAIRADLAARRANGPQLHVAIENWAHDLNIGSIVRTANAFNAAGVHIVGRRRWNRRGAMVTDRYLDLHHHEDAEALAALAASASLPIVGIDNLPGSIPLEGLALPRDVILLFGQESTGLTPEAQAVCESIVHITQHGSTRSMNAGAAGAIALWAWSTQHRG